MKMSRLISVVLLGAALVGFTPVYAQRSGGGSSHSSSVSSSRGSSSSSRGSSSSSRSSGYSSSSSRSSSSSSRSSSSSSRSSSGHSSSFSRSSSSSGSPSYSTGSYSSGSIRSSSSASGYSGNAVRRGGSTATSRSELYSRTGSVPTQGRSGASATGREGASRGTGNVRTDNATPSNSAPVAGGRPGGTPPDPGPNHPHPSPYFMHPHHHQMVHCHQIYWDPFPPRYLYWPGFWGYCNSYWYDYCVSDMVVVRNYVKDTYKMELVTYAISGDYMYALVSDPDGHTYLQIYDHNDKLLAEQQVSRKYVKMEVDQQNGGCWIMKKRDKDPLLFLYADGQLLTYEADK